MKYCFVFVCQQGPLEIKASLLAASLRRNLACEYELVAAVPGPETRWGRPRQDTLELLDELGVRCAAIENPVSPDYPIGNKVSCLGVPTDADKIVFLDSDILCTRRFDHQQRFAIPFNAKAADMNLFTQDINVWNYIYAKFGLALQHQRMLTTVSRELVPPYFNAGMIAVNNDPRFTQEWAEICRQIDADPAVQNKRPWLDQVALPITVAKLGMEYDCLDERYNYPAHIKPLARGGAPWFCHYHVPHVIRREPLLDTLFREILDQYPVLRQRISGAEQWAGLARPFAIGSQQGEVIAAPPAPLDGIVTGIPGSGARYLCSLLNTTGRSVAISEPPDAVKSLASQRLPWMVGVYHRNIRQRVLDGEPVEGGLAFPAHALRADFILFTQHAVAYINRITQLRRVFPDAPMIACIRNPYDTVAAWKSSASPLYDADVSKFPVGNPNDPFLNGVELFSLRQIAATPAAPLRRALLWCFLAEKVLEHAGDLFLVRYEDLLSDASSVVASIMSSCEAPEWVPDRPGFAPPAPGATGDALDKQDRLAIRSICGDVAFELGYDIDGNSLQ